MVKDLGFGGFGLWIWDSGCLSDHKSSSLFGPMTRIDIGIVYVGVLEEKVKLLSFGNSCVITSRKSKLLTQTLCTTCQLASDTGERSWQREAPRRRCALPAGSSYLKASDDRLRIKGLGCRIWG